MKQKSIRSAWLGAIFATLRRLLLTATALWLAHGAEGGLVRAALIFTAAVALGTIVPVWAVLKERLKEIEGGEENAAAQY